MKILIFVSCLLFFVVNAPVASAKSSQCGTDSQHNDVCTIGILDVHPTQFSVGMLEVKTKEQAIMGMSEKELMKFLNKHTIPTVIGPHHQFFLTDHHHLSRALYDAGVKSLNLEIQFDWSNITEGQFWAKMEAAHLVYLYDENGHGPLPVSRLPATVRNLADDIFRSLAWAVQKQTGAYQDTDSPYASFQWANFFRQGISADIVRSDFKKAVQIGANLARTPAASHLPGYLGR